MKERRNKGIIRFIKDWTLPVAMGLGTVIYLVFGLIPQLEEAAVFFDPIFDTILPMFMFLILFVTFCKVDFHKLRPVAWHFWICVFQLLFIGALMGIILLPSAISPDALILMEAILMCIISPCAAAAAVVTQKLGGSLEQMTTYTFISNFITAMMVPICFPLIEKGADMTFWTAFSKILYEVAIVLLVPMLLAYIVKHHAQQLHKRIISVKDLSYYLWACSLMIVTGTTVKNIVHSEATILLLLAIAAASFVLCFVQFAIGRAVGRRLGEEVNAGQALFQKNTALSIWVAYMYLHPVASVGAGCYVLWQNIINSIELWQYRKENSLHKVS